MTTCGYSSTPRIKWSFGTVRGTPGPSSCSAGTQKRRFEEQIDHAREDGFCAVHVDDRGVSPAEREQIAGSLGEPVAAGGAVVRVRVGARQRVILELPRGPSLGVRTRQDGRRHEQHVAVLGSASVHARSVTRTWARASSSARIAEVGSSVSSRPCHRLGAPSSPCRRRCTPHRSDRSCRRCRPGSPSPPNRNTMPPRS